MSCERGRIDVDSLVFDYSSFVMSRTAERANTVPYRERFLRLSTGDAS